MSSSSSSPPSPSSSSASHVAVVGWVVGSIMSSVGLILVNKVIMKEYNFSYVFTLTAAHFLVTALGMEVMACLGLFSRNRLPLRDTISMAVFCIGSVACMNFSLQLNSVGLYQVSKLMCIPCMVAIQSTFYGQQFSRKIKVTLAVVLLGVGIATVTDVSINQVGLLFAAAAVLFTTQFQIWQGAKQKEHGMNAMQMNHSQAMPSFIFCLLLAITLEMRGDTEATNVLKHDMSQAEFIYILASCVLALSVNLCTYGLIGKTSPVTYQVVGHAKTCLILLGGFVLWPITNSADLLKNLAGITVAMTGVIVYGHLQMMESRTPKPLDWCDLFCPTILHSLCFGQQSAAYHPLKEGTPAAPSAEEEMKHMHAMEEGKHANR